jgi:hypothetical protein
MLLQRRGTRRNRGTKQAIIQHSDLSIYHFLGVGKIRLEFTPEKGFDSSSTHTYQIDMRIDEFADLIDKLNWSTNFVTLREECSASVNSLAKSLRALALTLEGTV